MVSSCGAAPLNITSIGYSGSSAILLPGAQTCVGTLAPGATCQLAVQFSPTDTTFALGTITVQANTWQPTYTIAASGTGTSPNAEFYSSPLAFDPAYVGGTGTTQVGELVNNKTVTMLVNGPKRRPAAIFRSSRTTALVRVVVPCRFARRRAAF